VHELIDERGNRNNDDDHDDDDDDEYDNDDRRWDIENCDYAGNAIDNDSDNRISVKRMKSISNVTRKSKDKIINRQSECSSSDNNKGNGDLLAVTIIETVRVIVVVQRGI